MKSIFMNIVEKRAYIERLIKEISEPFINKLIQADITSDTIIELYKRYFLKWNQSAIHI